MKFRTDGLIIREQNIGENDRLVWVLTRSNGVVKAFARGAKKLTRAEKKTQRKARKAKKKQAKRRDHAMGLAAFALALVVGVVYKLTSKF